MMAQIIVRTTLIMSAYPPNRSQQTGKRRKEKPDEETWQGVNTALEDVPLGERGEIIIDNISVDSVDCGDK